VTATAKVPAIIINRRDYTWLTEVMIIGRYRPEVWAKRKLRSRWLREHRN
jgi:hypothetical protein